MLAVYSSPVYIIVIVCLLLQIQNWLGACHPVFRKTWMRIANSLVYLFLASSVLIAFFLPAGRGRRIMKLISNYWLGILLYLFLVVVTADMIYLIRFQIIKRKERMDRHYRNGAEVGLNDTRNVIQKDKNHRFHLITGGVCVVTVVILSAWGIYNARIIHVTPYDITVNKTGGRLENLNVVLVADLHLGYNIGTEHMMQMVDKINEQDADIVVIAGDIFDNEYEALDDPTELIAVLKKIQSKYGVYACYGNHDVEEKILAGFTFGDSKKKESSLQMDKFLEKAGIHLLQDEAVLINESFYLYGRPDAQRPGRGIDMRKTAAELMGELDTGKPIIVIDHEPKEFQELADAGVDVDLCGHTHDGQLFPANLVTALMWENSYGYMKKDQMHTIVTSGVGVFGPDMRMGTIAEICSIRVHFQSMF